MNKVWKPSTLGDCSAVQSFFKRGQEEATSSFYLLDASRKQVVVEEVSYRDWRLLKRWTFTNPLSQYGPDFLTLVERIKAEPSLQEEMQELFFNQSQLKKEAVLLIASRPLTYILMGEPIDQLGDDQLKFLASPSFEKASWVSLPSYNTFLGGDVMMSLAQQELEDGDLLLDLGANIEGVYRRNGRYLASSAEARPLFQADRLAQAVELLKSGQLTAQGRLLGQADQTLDPPSSWIQDLRLATGALSSMLEILLEDAPPPKRIFLFGLEGSPTAVSDLLSLTHLPNEWKEKIILKEYNRLPALKQWLTGQVNLPCEMDYLELSQVSGYYLKLARHMQWKR